MTQTQNPQTEQIQIARRQRGIPGSAVCPSGFPAAIAGIGLVVVGELVVFAVRDGPLAGFPWCRHPSNRPRQAILPPEYDP